MLLNMRFENMSETFVSYIRQFGCYGNPHTLQHFMMVAKYIACNLLVKSGNCWVMKL